MNDTPTPNKDEVNLDNLPLKEALRFVDENSTTGGLFTKAALNTLAAGCRELTAAREELAAVTEKLKETRKHLKDANRGAEINAHALRINADKLATVTEQRDEMARAIIRFNSGTCCLPYLVDLALQSLKEP